MIRGGRAWTVAALAASAAAGLYLAVDHYRSWKKIDDVRRSLYSADPVELVSTVHELRDARPQDAEIAYMLAVANRRAGRTNRARELLETAQQLGRPRADIQRQHYLIRFQAGDFEEAEQYLLDLTSGGYPDDQASEIYECIARSYLANMQLPETNAVLDYWLQWQPNAVQPRLIKADLLGAVHDVPGEIRECQEILRIDPDNFNVRIRLGRMLLDLNDTTGAQQQFETCAKLRPTGEVAALGLAICHGRNGDRARARLLLEQALEGELARGDRALALYEIGQLALADKEPRKAIEYFERAMELSPDEARLNYAYGVALTRVGKKEAAAAYLEKSKRLDELAMRFGDLLEEIMLQPGNPDLRCQAGRLALEANHRAEAYRWLSSALHCDPRHKPTHEALGEYYTKAGREDLAQRHLALAEKSAASVSATRD